MEGARSLTRPSTINLLRHLLAFQDDAFSMWTEWASFYAPESSQRALLDKVQEKRWLVNIVHHDFKRPDALWSFLLDEVVQS